MTNTHATSSCCHTPAPEGHTDLLATTAPTSDHATECPVMPGTVVNKATAEAAGLFRDYEGQRYWLCCAGCGPRFDADPATYARAAD
ncbi:YHS domain-containing protein [Brevibacterium jeotgali]|uniref:YHS domain-containing protein n=1 Tax=Brevibacterium jeotgali TaxID=1262550 RepID=A0A2H1L8T9_9MICO|nr:YHS domain-containing protein [Brevibacterium jeotgali]TWC01567.1 YHS domain-containing protein [Brevibacterium jeotgali]SMY13205.1 YHS domain-containing protein [Brevibacterium jeotgali]